MVHVSRQPFGRISGTRTRGVLLGCFYGVQGLGIIRAPRMSATDRDGMEIYFEVAEIVYGGMFSPSSIHVFCRLVCGIDICRRGQVESQSMSMRPCAHVPGYPSARRSQRAGRSPDCDNRKYFEVNVLLYCTSPNWKELQGLGSSASHQSQSVLGECPKEIVPLNPIALSPAKSISSFQRTPVDPA